MWTVEFFGYESLLPLRSWQHWLRIVVLLLLASNFVRLTVLSLYRSHFVIQCLFVCVSPCVPTHPPYFCLPVTVCLWVSLIPVDPFVWVAVRSLSVCRPIVVRWTKFWSECYPIVCFRWTEPHPILHPIVVRWTEILSNFVCWTKNCFISSSGGSEFLKCLNSIVE